MRRWGLNIVLGAVADSLLKMADFTRSVVWRFWTAVLLLGDMLVHLVHAATIEDHSDYQACLASPSTCTSLCAPCPPSRGFINLANRKCNDKRNSAAGGRRLLIGGQNDTVKSSMASDWKLWCVKQIGVWMMYVCVCTTRLTDVWVVQIS